MLPQGWEAVGALPDEALVLDVGGWAAPVNRADWVIDLMPYETRGALAPDGNGPGPARHAPSRWVIRDICDSEPWPFADDFFDFAICTFTLEDIRDPVHVCREMSRVARAGYVEVPSILDELTWRNPEGSGGPWLGHTHHRWLCSLQDGELLFLAKWHSLHARRALRVPPGRLSDQERVLAHQWKSAIPAREWPAIDDYPFDWLESLVVARFPEEVRRQRRLSWLARQPGRARWHLRRGLSAARDQITSAR